MSTLLAIETSCDESSASVVTHEPGARQAKVLSNAIFSQVELHRRFGGVVPEVASRNHLERLPHVVDEALQSAGVGFAHLDAIAVTTSPGLIGALLVGVSAAKAYAYGLNRPLLAVNHLSGHLHSLFIEGQKSCPIFMPEDLPAVVCLVSGGHTNLFSVNRLPPEPLNAKLLAQSRDDAAGEAFDKTAKLLGLPYPGGVLLDRLATKGDSARFDFPRPLRGEHLEFSFSGLKTAVANQLSSLGFTPHRSGPPPASGSPEGQLLWDFAASIQEAIVDCLMEKIHLAVRVERARSVAIVGGVSANSRLRARLLHELAMPVRFPDLQYCTDNAAMIGAAAAFAFERGQGISGKNVLGVKASASSHQGPEFW
jgi:N6-L-threonylcarbamoyladenine synthase